MRPNVVLIDFENVRPDNLHLLAREHFRVLVFVGASQNKVPFETAAALQKLGAQAEYIKVSGNGSNALDFHIAFYIGQLAAQDPTTYFHIVSKDAGFDPLIAHLKARDVFAGRVHAVDDIPMLKSATKKTPQERARVVMDKLLQPKTTRPRTLKTLHSTVATLFQKQLSESEVGEVVDDMLSSGFFALEGAKVKFMPQPAAQESAPQSR